MDRQPGHLMRDTREAVNNITWIKVIALGNASVGKTCLIKHFCESKFSQCYHATVGVDYGFKVQTVKGTPYRVHLWDLSGDDQYYDVRTELYNGSDACFLVFDVTNPASFQNLDNLLREMGKFGALNAKIAVVGNKADLRSNVRLWLYLHKNAAKITTIDGAILFQKGSVSASDGRKWATAHKLPYYETSALTGDGVATMFQDLLNSVSEKQTQH